MSKQPSSPPLPELLPALGEGAEASSPLLDGEDFELTLDRSEALGEMLGSLAPEDPLSDIPGAVMDGPVPLSGDSVGEEASLEVEAAFPEALSGSGGKISEFEESTRMVAVGDQQRLAQEAMRGDDEEDEEDHAGFGESTRLVSSAEQFRIASQSLVVAEPLDEDELEGGLALPEVSVSLDDEFYDSIQIDAEQAEEAKREVEPEEPAEGLGAQDSQSGVGEPASGEDAAEVSAGVSTPAPKGAAAVDLPPMAAPQGSRPLLVELDDFDEDSGLGSLDMLLGLGGEMAPARPPAPPLPTPAGAPSPDVKGEAQSDVEGLGAPSDAAEPESAQGGTVTPAAIPETGKLGSTDVEDKGATVRSDMAGSDLQSLEALLGTPPGSLSAAAEPDLSSMDELLGIAAPAPLAGSAGAALTGGLVSPAPGAPVTRLGWDLPEPPEERLLGALAELAIREPLVKDLPQMDEPLQELAPLDLRALPEQMVFEKVPERAWREVVSLLVAEADLLEDAPVSAALEVAAGEVLELCVESWEDAQPHFYEAIARDGASLPGRRGQLRCAVQAADWGTALEALSVLERGTDGGERGAYRMLNADLSLATMGDLDAARHGYSGLLDSPSTATAALLGLLDVAVLQADMVLVASTMRRLAEVVASPVLADPVALAAAQRLEALEQDEQAMICFARAAQDTGDVGHAARAGLVRITERRGEWAQMADHLRSVVLEESPGPVRTEAASRLFRVLFARMGLGEEAFSVAGAAAREAPEDMAAGIRFALVAEELRRYHEAAAAWTEVAEKAAGADLGAICLVFAGQLREGPLGDSAGALKTYRAAQDRSPDVSVAEVLERELRLRSPELSIRVDAWLSRARGCSDGPERDAVHCLAAREWARHGQVAMAQEILVRAGEAGNPRRGLLRDLAVLQLAAGDSEEAARTLLALAGQVEPPLAEEHRLGAAWLLAREAEENRRKVYAEVLAHDESLQPLVWAGQRAHRILGDLASWQGALVAEAEVADDWTRASRLWRLVGWGHLWQGQAESASEALGQAVRLDPADALSRWGLMRISAGSGDMDEVVRMEADLAERARGPGARCLWRIRQAVCLEESLNRPSEAVELWHSLALAYPGWAEAEDTHLRMRRWAGDRREVSSALQAQAQAAQGVDDRVAKLVLAAKETDLAGEPEGALPLLAEAASLAPEDPVVRTMYDAVEADLGNWSALADRALATLEEAPDDRARVAAYQALAAIDRDGRQDLPSAILAYESIVGIESHAAFALRELEIYYPGEGRMGELADVVLRLAEGSQGTQAVVQSMEWARLQGDAGDLGGTVRGLRMAFAADPDYLPALTRLEVHARREERHEELARIYVAVSRYFAADARSRAVFLLRAAEASLRAQDVDLARRQVAEASAAAPGYLPAVEERLRLALLKEDWSEAASAAEARAQVSGRRAVRVQSQFLAGVLAQEWLRDDAHAIKAYQAVLELDPEHAGAFERLSHLWRVQERWSELGHILAARVEVLGERQVSSDLLWELASVQLGHLNDPQAAKATLRRLVTVDEQRLDAVKAAVDLYESDGQFVEVADMLIRQARLERDPAELVRVFFRLGQLYDEQIPDPQRAVASFGKVLQMDPQHLGALERLAAIHQRQEDWKAALAVTGRIIEVETRPQRRIDHLVSVARIFEKGYRDPWRAREALIKALELDPLDLNAVGELTGFYQRQKDRRALMVHLDRTIGMVRAKLSEEPFNVDNYRTLAKLFGWRQAPDQEACVAAVLVAIGHGTAEDRELLAASGGRIFGLDALANPELDDVLFPPSIIGGFRHIFQLLGDLLGRYFREDLAKYGASRQTRVTSAGEPLRALAMQMASRLGVRGFDLYVVSERPCVVAVEPYDPPAILLGREVVEGASESELTFVLGRCLKVVQGGMILPLKLSPVRLQGLVAGIVRQYMEDFEAREVPPVELVEQTKAVAKQLSRKLKGELMPFAYECAGITDFERLAADLVNVANQAGLLACGDLRAAISVLLREAGRGQGVSANTPLAEVARGITSVERLLGYAVSDEYFELRRRVGLA